jgi:quercetin dioxygenase-like cupin family protein
VHPLRSRTKNASFDFPGYPSKDETSGRKAAVAKLGENVSKIYAFLKRIRMSQKAGAAKSARQSEAPAHQPGQDVFKPILPDDIEWKPFPAFPPSVRLAVLVGRPSEPAPYTIRVKSPHGAKLMPHKHPEDRVYTVISGVFYIGLGDEFDASKLEAYPPGAVVILPGNTSHFHWAKSGEYVTQITAMGPLGLEYVSAKDDPRNSNS